jgi:hypothetical protein
MYRWDLETDEFTPGQFVRAGAEVMAVSPDAKYVVYYGCAYHRPEVGYVAISHLPYFTAHAFFKQFTCGVRAARFVSSERMKLVTWRDDATWRPGNEDIHERIDPRCPFEIDRLDIEDFRGRELSLPDWCGPNGNDLITAVDAARDRRIVCEGGALFACDLDGANVREVRRFPRETFEEVAPPEWATRW